eukprot:13315-Chlamydomonas_euryale.AAC.1
MGVGSILNLQSNDAQKLYSMPTYLHMVWNAPFQICVVMLMLVRILGWQATVAGAGVTVALVPFSWVWTRVIAASRRQMVKHTDARVKLSSEVRMRSGGGVRTCVHACAWVRVCARARIARACIRMPAGACVCGYACGCMRGCVRACVRLCVCVVGVCEWHCWCGCAACTEPGHAHARMAPGEWWWWWWWSWWEICRLQARLGATAAPPQRCF